MNPRQFSLPGDGSSNNPAGGQGRRRHIAALLGAPLIALLAFVPGCELLPAEEAAAEPSQAPAPVQAKASLVTSVEGITEYRLDNGLRFLLFPDQSKQQITVNVTYLVGSRHESYGETGMAHLLEHLVFKGSTRHPDISAELSEHGAFANGTTWVDRTNYYETFPATDENLDWALDLESDRMVNSFIKREDLDSEMTVVRNEWERGENSPQRVLQQRVASAAYLWHNYGNSTIGARADIENVPIDRLKAFYRKFYQPDNAILVVAGRFDPEATIALIEQKFGAIPRPERTGANQLFPTYTAEPAQDGERTVTLRRVGDVQLAVAAYHIPAGSDEQYAATSVLSHLLGTEPSGRLYKRVVEPGLAASADTYAAQFNEPGLLLASIEVRQEDSLAEATEAMLATMHGLAEEPPTQEEVDRAKAEYASSFELAFNNPQAIALELSEWAAMGDWRLMFLDRDRHEGVTPEQVLAAAQAYLQPSNRTMGYFYPTDAAPPRAEVPAKGDVAAMLAGYTGREAVAQGEAFDPTPANIERRTRKLTLDNGIEVALLPKSNRGGAVSLSVAFRHGTEASLAGKATAASLAGAMLMRGTANRTREQIRDEMVRLKTQGSLSGGPRIVSGGATTVRESLPEVIRLLAEVLREPAFDEDEFELLREELLAGIEAQRSEPDALAQNTLQRHLAGERDEDHVFYVPTFDEQVALYESATLAEARDFWASFYGAEGGTLAIVGDFDPNEIVPVLQEAFRDWNAAEDYQRVDDPFLELPALIEDIETPDKTNAMMFAAQTIQMRDDHEDYPALVMANYLLGGGFLSSRLATRIRQQDGLSYGVGSQFGSHPIDDVATFLAYAIFAPENGDRVVAAFKEEIARALESGFTEEEVEAGKRGYLDFVQNGRSNDGSVAGTLAGNLFFDRTMAFIADQEAAIEALTPEDINAALRRHMSLDKMSIVRGGDFANKLP